MIFKKNKKLEKNFSFVEDSIEMEGTLITNGELKFNSKFKGVIYADKVNFGSTTDLQGNLQANEVVFDGSILGNITAKDNVVFLKDSKVVGQIKTSSLSIDEGALIDGTIEIHAPSKTVINKPNLKKLTKPINHLDPKL